MKILAHRGYWNREIENNSAKAIRMALENGYGFESDIRDYCGNLVISHNIACNDSLAADEVFQWLREFDDHYCFAVNIKADGLKELIKESLLKYDISNYFLFDMSVPQMVEFADYGLRFYTRQSEYEKEPVMYEQASGVWIDGFYSDSWITQNLLGEHIQRGKVVCIVSPDLHKRKYQDLWSMLKDFDLDFTKVMLCTDYPELAAEFFASKLER